MPPARKPLRIAFACSDGFRSGWAARELKKLAGGRKDLVVEEQGLGWLRSHATTEYDLILHLGDFDPPIKPPATPTLAPSVWYEPYRKVVVQDHPRDDGGIWYAHAALRYLIDSKRLRPK